MRLITIITGLIILLVIYLYLLFPILDKDHRREPITVKIDCWQTDQKDSLGYYYIEQPGNIPVDKLIRDMDAGIFVVDFSKRKRHSITLKNEDKFVLPFTNNYTSKTLRCFSSYLRTKDQRYLDIFLMNARWMQKNAQIISDSIAVLTNDNMIYEKYELSFGWPSSYAQGFGLSIMCRAMQATGDTTFISFAEKVLNSFLLSYKNGGICDIDPFGNFWYLEYPADPPGYVLNGMVFGLFGLYDFYRMTGSEKAKFLFDQGVETLVRNLDRYDMGYWSSYDLLYDGYCAGYRYHKYVHIPQLKILYQLTGNTVFKSFYERFEKYLQEPYYTIFKVQFTLDAIHRRLTYKNPF